MSLFDVIKYPISFPPTMEELEALPDDVFQLWTYNWPSCLDASSRKFTRQIISIYYRQPRNNEVALYIINDLKRLIYERS